jgi:SH3-like domain-containing protein
MQKKIISPFIIFFLILPALLIFPQSNAEALCINNKKANLRQGPGTHYEKLWQVFKYMPFKEMKKKGNWYRVKDLDGDIYWVHRKLITKNYQCAVIKSNKTNLRKGPGTKYDLLSWSPVDKYFSMKVLLIKGRWVRVEDGVGDKGWVSRSLIWIQ